MSRQNRTFSDHTKLTDERQRRRLVIVVRADPVICGHSGEARNLAEAALQRGFTEVRILSWPLDLLVASGLPLKPLDGMTLYSEGIEVERPEPVGDYKVVDGRYLAGMTGRLVELFTDGVPTVCMSLYLSPHTIAVSDALRVAQSTGLPVPVITIAEAVGSDVTNVVRSCVADGRFGAAAQVLVAYLDSDVPVAVSDYTRELIISSAADVDARHGTDFADRCRQRVAISYPAINTADYLGLDPELMSRGTRPSRSDPERLRALPLPAGPRQGRRRTDPRVRRQRGLRRPAVGDRGQRAAGRLSCAPWPPAPRPPIGSSSSTTSTTTRSPS